MHVVVTQKKHERSVTVALSTTSLPLLPLLSAPDFTSKVFYINENAFDPDFFFNFMPRYKRIGSFFLGAMIHTVTFICSEPATLRVQDIKLIHSTDRAFLQL